MPPSQGDYRRRARVCLDDLGTGAGDKLVGLLQLLFKVLDGDERRITLQGPGELEAALTSVSVVLGFNAGKRLVPQGARRL